MPVRGPALLLITIVLGCCFGAAQQSAQTAAPTPVVYPWAVLVDPVCPVSLSPQIPSSSREIRVFYFPKAMGAKLKNPKSLSLQIAFNGPHYSDNNEVIPFSRSDDYWEAVVPQKIRVAYAVFDIKDGSGALDDNGGQYWDLVYCDPQGQKDPSGLFAQARSYKGETWPLGIRRSRDMAKAVSLMEKVVATNDRGPSWALRTLWEFQAQRDGGDAKAWKSVAAETDELLAKNPDDISTQQIVAGFVIDHQEDLPPDFVERTINALDSKRIGQSNRWRGELAYNRAVRVVDPKKRLAAIDLFITTYPNATQSTFAQAARFYCFLELKDITNAEAALASYRSTTAKHPEIVDEGSEDMALAELYIEEDTKLESALSLLDRSSKRLNAEMKSSPTAYGAGIRESMDAQFEIDRARAYLALHRFPSALDHADKAVAAQMKSAEAHAILAAAFAATGNKQRALDEYFEAALRPSNKDLDYRAELERYYRQYFGDLAQYEVELNRRIAERFQATNYVPALLDQPAPTLAFTTVRGERFDESALKGKIVVVNFWSPG